MKIFDLDATVAEFNPIASKISVLKKKIVNYQLIKIFLEDKSQQFEEWKKHRQIPFCYTKVSTLQLGLVGYRNMQLKDVWKSWHLLTDELHNANCWAFSLKTYNMPAPDTQFSFKLCSLWRKLNDFKKHLPFTKKCRKRKTLRVCAICESYD